MFRASYSILQDELFEHMTQQGFKGFQRGEYGSTAEHLTSLQYQIKQDKQRLEKLEERIQMEQVKYKSTHKISKTLSEIDSMGQKTFTGKMAISKEDYAELTELAKEENENKSKGISNENKNDTTAVGRLSACIIKDDHFNRKRTI